MPGWYVHTETARMAADRLRAGDVPAGWPLGPGEAQELGELAHTWRNYLALGSLGPDLFFLLPDFAGREGEQIRRIVDTSLDIWQLIDDKFLSVWEKWIDPIGANDADLAAQLTGGLSNEFGEALDLLSTSLRDFGLGLLTRFGDIFGWLSSGVPKSYANSAFYWSDMFHYRRTYQFPWELYRRARTDRDNPDGATDEERESNRRSAEARMVFALGWISHCATDVTGHAWTNAKTGGPYRLHWQRHHLVENHMDAHNYNGQQGGSPFYAECGTSALHFRIAFRNGAEPGYVGREDQPAYDYFAGFPTYDLSRTAVGRLSRHQFFDLDTQPLPGHLCTALIHSMREVYGADAPRILETDAMFSDGGSGRPNEAALQEMWQLVYRYLKLAGSDGLSPSMPVPPVLINEHPFPVPPGFDSVGDDPARGVDLDDDDFNLLDLLLALFAWILYIGQIITWLTTVLPGLILDVATFPARDVVYRTVLVPAWNLYMVARRLLVYEGFLMPKPEEIDKGLVTLGVTSLMTDVSLAASLDAPSGFATGNPNFPEPSGRRSITDAFSADPAFPRQIVHDRRSVMGALHLLFPRATYLSWVDPGTPADPSGPSAWIAPWRYPLRNEARLTVGWEGELAHPGPHIIGEDTSVLFAPMPSSAAAIGDFEAAATPEDTDKACGLHLPHGEHLGGPVDYTVRLTGALVAGRSEPSCPVPDFNLDSDRGYASRCWDWLRKDPSLDAGFNCTPELNDPVPDPTVNDRFTYPQACTVPELYDAADYQASTPAAYDPMLNLSTHYLDRRAPAPGPCDDDEKRRRRVRDEQIDQAGGPPEGGN
ncbi:hypothetical protein [Streptomyces longisporoflavus]|uniref:Phospholipase C/D domain-containing protein n=1 Tax=Streptomyces longisporoflavus TaxID=28044 RepID=A0ABW7QZW2_9ACTN